MKYSSAVVVLWHFKVNPLGSIFKSWRQAESYLQSEAGMLREYPDAAKNIAPHQPVTLLLIGNHPFEGK